MHAAGPAYGVQTPLPRVTPGPGLRLFHLLLALVLFLICFLAYWIGALPNALNFLLLLAVPWMLLSRVLGLWRGTLQYGLLRWPWRPAVRPYLLQLLNHGLFWGLLLMTSRLTTVAIQVDPDDLQSFEMLTAGSAVIVLLLELVPSRRLYLSTNALFAVGWMFLASQLAMFLVEPSPADGVVIDPPFRGEWFVIHGGRSALFNHHYPLQQQRHALDIDKLVNGRDVQGDPQKLESYPAFGQQLYAPAAGKVVKAVSDRPDMAIGKTDEEHVVANHLVIEIGPERFVLLAHLRKGSVVVAKGDTVRAGQPIARCGNSGNTTQPHLHLQVQNRADFWAADLQTFPIFFRNIDRIRGGRRTHETEAYVRRNDWIVVPEK